MDENTAPVLGSKRRLDPDHADTRALQEAAAHPIAQRLKQIIDRKRVKSERLWHLEKNMLKSEKQTLSTCSVGNVHQGLFGCPCMHCSTMCLSAIAVKLSQRLDRAVAAIALQVIQ